MGVGPLQQREDRTVRRDVSWIVVHSLPRLFAGAAAAYRHDRDVPRDGWGWLMHQYLRNRGRGMSIEEIESTVSGWTGVFSSSMRVTR